MKKETFSKIAIVLAMLFMFCLGSRMEKQIPLSVQTVVGLLMIVFSVLSRKGQNKAIRDV